MYAALAVAAVLLFASCKNDKSQPNDQEKADAYVSFTFNLPQSAGLTHYNSISKISSGVIRASFFLRRSVDVPLSLSLSR